MRVAVAGGTGAVGALLVGELVARGDDVRIVSRRPPARSPHARVSHRSADVATGEGLSEALDGMEAVVDAVNGLRRAQAVLVAGTRRLLDAEAAAGVGHHVAISIVGCDRVPLAYYEAKIAQEAAVAGGPVPWSLLRATQFHALLDGIFGTAARLRVAPHGDARLQPIDPAVVAARLADAVHAGPGGRLANVAGPQVQTLSELAGAWHAARPRCRRALRVQVPAVGRAGRALRAGGLCEPAASTAGPTFTQWLARTRAMHAEHGPDAGA